MNPVQPVDRITQLGALVLLVLLPLALLGPAVFGDAAFTPFDPARFSPALGSLSPEDAQGVLEQRSNFDVTETPLLVLPEIELAQEEIAAGRFPGWNPYARFGGPLFANGLAGLAYPPHAPTLLASSDPTDGLGLAAWLSYAIASLLCFAFLRACGLGVATAVLGAIVFAFGGAVAANAHFYMRMNALIWLPGMLWACLGLERRVGKDRIPAAIGFALCLALTWLAGFPPYAIMSTGFAACFGGWMVGRCARRAGARSATALAGWLAAATLIGFAACSAQLVPLLAYFPQSSRDLDPPLNAIAQNGFDPMGFLGYLAPTLFGAPDGSLPAYDKSALALLLHTRSAWVDGPDGSAGQPFFPSNYNFTEYSVFVGGLPLLLALRGVISRALSVRTVMVMIGAMFAIVAIAPSWLQPLYELPAVTKTPMRFIAALTIVLASLAAAGFESIRQDRARVATFAVIGIGFCVALGALWIGIDPPAPRALAERLAVDYAHLLPAEDPVSAVERFIGLDQLEASSARLRSSALSAAARFGLASAWLLALAFARPRARPSVFRVLVGVSIVWVAAELVSYASISNTFRTRPKASTETAVQAFLREHADPGAGGVTVARAGATPRAPLDLPSGLLFRDRIRDLNAYAFLDPWSHRPFRALYGPGQMMREVWPKSFPDDERLGLPLFDLLGLRYLLTSDPELHHAGTAVGLGVAGFRVYERPDPMPRAFVVPALRVVADDDAAVAALIAPDLEPRASVLVTPAAAQRLGPLPAEGTAPVAGDGAAPTPPGARTVRFRRDLPEDLLLEIGPGSPGYLVLADACLDGWDVSVNGHPAPVARGNLFMRVVKLDARGAAVRFHYTPPGLHLGFALSALALLTVLCGAVVWIDSRRRRRSVELTS